MAYSNIAIVVQDEAEPGDVVPVKVSVTNLFNIIIYVIPVLIVNGVTVDDGSYEYLLPAGEEGSTVTWNLSFIMPNVDATVVADSWCEDTFPWHLDDTVQKIVEVLVSEPKFQNLVVAYNKGGEYGLFTR